MPKTPYDDKKYLQLINEMERAADEIADMEGNDADHVKELIDNWAEARGDEDDE